MTTTHHGRTALFLAPPAGEADELRTCSPLIGEEAMRRLRNPFRTVDGATGDTGRAGAEQ